MTETSADVRILIADSQSLFREAVRAVLDGEKGLEVVGEARSGDEALAEDGKMREAIAAFNRARELDPQNVDVLYALGDALFEAQQPEEALRTYERILALNEGEADAWVSMGLLHFNQERMEQAEECYQKALRLEPDSVFALNSLCDACYAQGRNGEALAR